MHVSCEKLPQLTGHHREGEGGSNSQPLLTRFDFSDHLRRIFRSNHSGLHLIHDRVVIRAADTP